MGGSQDSHLPTEGPACPIILSKNPSERSGSLEVTKLPAVWTLSPVTLFEVPYYYVFFFWHGHQLPLLQNLAKFHVQKNRWELPVKSCSEAMGARSAETPDEDPSVCRGNSLSLPGASLPPPAASPCTQPRPWLTAPACNQAEVVGSVVAAGSQVLTLCSSTSSEPRQSKQTCKCILVTDTPGNRNICITYSINRHPGVLGNGTLTLETGKNMSIKIT